LVVACSLFIVKRKNNTLYLNKNEWMIWVTYKRDWFIFVFPRSNHLRTFWSLIAVGSSRGAQRRHPYRIGNMKLRSQPDLASGLTSLDREHSPRSAPYSWLQWGTELLGKKSAGANKWQFLTLIFLCLNLCISSEWIVFIFSVRSGSKYTTTLALVVVGHIMSNPGRLQQRNELFVRGIFALKVFVATTLLATS